MRSKFLPLVVVAALAGAARAQEAGQLGLGLMLGAPTGGTAKYWTKKTQAIDAGVGFSGNLVFHADYLWHAWEVLPQPNEGKLGGYVGLGGRFRNREKDSLEFGFRTPLGIAYWVARRPIELFVEIAPVFKVNANSALDLDGLVGLRVHFEPNRGRR